MNKISTEERSEVFNRMLDEAGLAQWGRASRLSEACGISPATASGWLSGSLPRDCVSLLNCCDEFDLDVYKWVSGIGRGKSVNIKKVERNINRLKQYEADFPHAPLDAERFSQLAIMLYENEEKAEYMLDNMANFMPRH